MIFSGGGGGAGAVCVTPEDGVAVLSVGAAFCAAASGARKIAKRAKAGMKPVLVSPGVAVRAQWVL